MIAKVTISDSDRLDSQDIDDLTCTAKETWAVTCTHGELASGELAIYKIIDGEWILDNPASKDDGKS